MSARGQLTVSESSWHYRLYQWWVGQFAVRQRQIDLCRYVRTLVLWLPLTLLAVAISTVVWVAVWPLRWLLRRPRPRATLTTTGRLVRRFLEGWGVRIWLSGIVIGSCWMVGFMLYRAFARAWWVGVLAIESTIVAFVLILAAVWLAARLVERRRARRALAPAATDGVVRLAAAWVVAKKNRTCPLIEVKP